MNQFIATFYSHFGAIRYKKTCEDMGIIAKVMPVPRSLSSSCGTCVKYESEMHIIDQNHMDELEQIVKITDNGYEKVYSEED